MKRFQKILIALLIVALLVSLALNVYQYLCGNVTYLQRPEEIEIMTTGMLKNNQVFREGENISFTYDMENALWQDLKKAYPIEAIAGEGSEFQKAMRLMDEYAPRLTHKGNYENRVEMNAMDLLAYSLDRKDQGINCRAKAQILNEMCLALGMYSRKVWIMPYSGYDHDCHVVNEVWDGSLSKWVMLDITNNQFWIDENGTPLSVLEIREKGAKQAFCTPVCPEDDTAHPEKLKEKYRGEYLYIMKNMVYMEYMPVYTTGETNPYYLLMPVHTPVNYEWLLSEKTVTAAPGQ